MPQDPPPLPDFTRWPSFPFEGDIRVKHLAEPVAVEPPRSGEDAADCVACNTPDDSYIWVSERWRVRGMDRPTGLPVVLILECRSHLDIGDLPSLLAAELGVMTVRLERAIRSLDGVARVHVNRWGDGSAHLHMWFLARPYGRLQLRGTFLSLWDDLLPVISEEEWLENLALVAEWLAGFGGRAIAEPAHIHWESPSTFGNEATNRSDNSVAEPPAELPDPRSDGTAHGTNDRNDLTAAAAAVEEGEEETRDLSSYAIRLTAADSHDEPAVDGDSQPAMSGADEVVSGGGQRLASSGTYAPATDGDRSSSPSAIDKHPPDDDEGLAAAGSDRPGPEGNDGSTAEGDHQPAADRSRQVGVRASRDRWAALRQDDETSDSEAVPAADHEARGAGQVTSTPLSRTILPGVADDGGPAVNDAAAVGDDRPRTPNTDSG